MVTRKSHLDKDTLPPMRYLVAEGCPKLLEGHKFYACACFGPAIPSQNKPEMMVKCLWLESNHEDLGSISCKYGAADAPHGAQFGIPTVAHAGEDTGAQG